MAAQRSMTFLTALLLAAGLAGPAAAQETAGEVAVSGQVTSVNGDEARLREQSLGERNGLNLELFRYQAFRTDGNTRLDARFVAGGSGWLDFESVRDSWRFGLRITRVNRWSDSSFANDLLPSGASVSGLAPGTTSLPGWLGPSFPQEDMLWGQAWATYRFAGANRIRFRVGATSLNGERVPSIGGFSFSDVGTPAFFAAGLETDDSSSVWGAVEGRFHIGEVAVAADAGLSSRDDRRSRRLPAYGSAGLLDVNQWDEGHNVDTAWARIAAVWTGEAWGVSGAVAWSDSSNDPAGGDRRVDAGGATVVDGLTVAGGSVDSDAFSGALSVSWRPTPSLLFSLAGDALSASADGGVDLTLGGQPFVPASSTMDHDRVGGTALAEYRGAGGALRLRVRGASSEIDLRESREPFSQDLTRSTDRLDARLDATTRLAAGWRLRGWARWRDDDVEVDLKDLWNGYLPGNWERQTSSGLLALEYRGSDLVFGVTGSVSDSDIDSDIPWFDPIFDPTLALAPVSASEKWQRVAASLLWNGGRGSVWAELGWLSGELDFPVSELAGATPASERISGAVAVLGGDFQAWDGGTVAGQLEWVDNGDDLDRSLLRSWLRVEQEIGQALSVFARWSYWDFSNTFATADEYTAHVFAAGVRATF